MVKPVALLNTFVETVMHFIFQDSLMNRKLKEQAFTLLSCFINLMHPCWKSINFFKKYFYFEQ